MSIYARPGETVESSFKSATSGLVGTVGYAVYEFPSGGTLTARTTAGIIEVPAGSGTYYTKVTAPTKEGYYAIAWDTGVISPSTTFSDVLVVSFGIKEPGPLEGTNLISLAELRAAKKLEATDIDPGREANYELAIAVASDAVRAFADRSFGVPTKEGTRLFEYEDSQYVDIDDAMEIKEVNFLFGELTSPITPFYWRAEPQAGPPYIYLTIPRWAGIYSPEMGFTRNLDVVARERGWPGLIPQVQVKAMWGWPSVPAGVRAATVLTALEFAEVPDPYVSESIAGYQYATAVRSSGGGQAGSGAPTLVPEAIPSRAQGLLMPYVRVLV